MGGTEFNNDHLRGCAVSPPVELEFCVHTSHPPNFWYAKNADRTKNQVSGLCVGGDITICWFGAW